MSSTEHYPGYFALLSYLNEREHVDWSYYEFLILNRDVIISSPLNIEDWNGLDGTWTRRFLKNAETMLESKDFETLKVKPTPDSGVSVNVLAQVMVVAPLVSQRPDSRVDSERSKHGIKTYWENVIHEQKKLNVKRTHILGSLDLLDKAGKHNIENLSSEGFSNSFPVNTTPVSKHALDGSNSTSSQRNKKTKAGENEEESVEETVIQEDILHSIAETTNTFGNVEFPEYYNKLKKIWRTRETGSNYYVIDMKNREILNEVHNLLDAEELKLLYDRLSPQSEDKYLSKKALQYLSLFDQNSEGYSDNEEIEDEIILEMKKEVCNLDGLIAKFQYLSHALPIPLKQYNELLYPEIHIIKSIAGHLSAITKMEGITDNTTERSSDGVAELFKRPKQIPMFILEVSGDPGNPDPDKYNDDRKKLFREGIFALNKFITRTDLPNWEVCTSLGVFLSQGYEDNLEIGQLIYIGPGLYIYSPFTIPNLIIPTTPFNLQHAPRLIRTLLYLRHKIIKTIRSFQEFEEIRQRSITNPTYRYPTGFTPDRFRTVTFKDFLPEESRKEASNRVDEQENGWSKVFGFDSLFLFSLSLSSIGSLGIDSSFIKLCTLSDSIDFVLLHGIALPLSTDNLLTAPVRLEVFSLSSFTASDIFTS
ncbi:2134_t:CDS:2 [Dentiscutata erythropus]|uniref:2134_t:CDS:1 n=1 Tax=Dentiscutata erythropus TaxID=1348616 RepID=A0A9N9D6P1_9GLOM|nr:2134_t:CDS:2 [Dentiscutata erythropus]